MTRALDSVPHSAAQITRPGAAYAHAPKVVAGKTLDAEQSLLLATARLNPDVALLAEIHALCTPGLDWERVIRLATLNGTLPLLQANLTRADAVNFLPHTHSVSLREHLYENLQQVLALSAELSRIFERLEKSSIDARVLKGPALAIAVYGKLTLRHFTDLDLLVQPQDVSGTRALLEELGYQPQFKLNDQQFRSYARTHIELAFVHPDTRQTVDLHWGLVPANYSFCRGLDSWANCESIEICGKRYKTFGREESFLMLCLHGARHGWGRLSWLVDLAELIRSTEAFNLSAQLDYATQRGCGRMVRVGLYLCEALLGLSLPPAVSLQVKSDSELPGISKCILAIILAEGSAAADLVAADSFYPRLMESGADRLRFAFERVLRPTPLEWELVQLPPILSPLYYVVRPFRLLAKRLQKARLDNL